MGVRKSSKTATGRKDNHTGKVISLTGTAKIYQKLEREIRKSLQITKFKRLQRINWVTYIQ
jgi:hypothetical protein